jgi:hypothetical protein
VRGFYSGFFTVFKVSLKRLISRGESVVKVDFQYIFRSHVNPEIRLRETEKKQASARQQVVFVDYSSTSISVSVDRTFSIFLR